MTSGHMTILCKLYSCHTLSKNFYIAVLYHEEILINIKPSTDLTIPIN